MTFREADHGDGLAPAQKVAVKHAFYANLTGRAYSSQIIMFENEDPDPALQVAAVGSAVFEAGEFTSLRLLPSRNRNLL